MTTPTVQSAGVRGAQPVTGARSASASSGDAFAAALSRSETVERRPAERPAPRHEPAQQRRLDPIQVRRTDLSAGRPTTIAQRDRPGADLGVTRPRGATPASSAQTRQVDGAGTTTGAASSSAGSVDGTGTPAGDTPTGSSADTAQTTDPTAAPADAAALLAQQLAAAEAAAGQVPQAGLVPVVEQPAVETDGAAPAAEPVAEVALPTAAVVAVPGTAAAAADAAAPAVPSGSSAATADATTTTPAAAGATAAAVSSTAGTSAAQAAVGTPAAPATPTATTSAVDGAAAQVAAPTAQGAGTSADLGQESGGSARTDGAAAAATSAPTSSTSSSSSFAQTLAGLTPTAPAERVAVAPPVPATGAAAPSLAEQVRGPVMALRHAAPGEHTLTLQVTPDSLGPVQVKAHIGAAGVRIELLGVTDAGRDGLRALLTDLRRDLAGTGMNASLSLAGDGDRPQGGLAGEWGGGPQDGRGPTARPGLRADPGANVAELPTETARPAAPTTGATGVDVLT